MDPYTAVNTCRTPRIPSLIGLPMGMDIWLDSSPHDLAQTQPEAQANRATRVTVLTGFSSPFFRHFLEVIRVVLISTSSNTVLTDTYLDIYGSGLYSLHIHVCTCVCPCMFSSICIQVSVSTWYLIFLSEYVYPACSCRILVPVF